MSIEKESLIITKEGWKRLRIEYDLLKGFTPKPDEVLERIYKRIPLKNDGYKEIENEIRVEKLRTGFDKSEMIAILKKFKLPYRNICSSDNQ